MHIGPEAKFLDEIQTKVLRVFSLLFTVTSTAFLEISISSNSRKLLTVSRAQLLYTVIEKGGKPDRKVLEISTSPEGAKIFSKHRISP
jgi:hypothetical protein